MDELFHAGAGSSHSSGSKAESQGTCRICLQKGTISLYENKHFNTIKAIKCVAGLTIMDSDPFTKLICLKCYTLLRGAVVFRRKAQKSYCQLKERLESTNEVSYRQLDYQRESKKYVSNLAQPTQPQVYEENIPSPEHLSATASQVTFQSNNSDSDSDSEPLINCKEAFSKTIGIEKKPAFVISKKVQCKKCLKLVPKAFFKGHMAEHNGIFRPDGKLECKICSKVLLRKSFLQHISTMHSDDCRKFICEHCGKVFTHQGSYYGHLVSHKTEYPFKCEQCDYRGPSEPYLRAHMRKHIRSDRFQCNKCAAQFTNNGNLTKHMLRHAGKNMKCSDCDKCFYTSTEVEKHYEVEHLGLKKHECNMCGKLFGYRSAMMKHQLGVHKRPSRGHGRTPCYLQSELKS